MPHIVAEPCPPWCKGLHLERWSRTVDGSLIRDHEANYWPEVGGYPAASVSVFATETAGLGILGPMTVHLVADDASVDLAPEEARRVAAHLVEAADLAERLAPVVAS